MCLYIRKDRFSYNFAEQDIIIYKVLVCINEQLFTPFQCTQVDINKLLSSTTPEIIEETKNYYVIGSGFIHSYTNYRDAVDYATMANCTLKNMNYFVYKAIIPKGVKYIIGENGQICSKCIKFKRKIF